MAAAVKQRAELAIPIPQHDDRAQAQPRGDEIVVPGDLALVREIDPHRAEDVGHLGLEDRGIGIDQAVDAVLLDQLVPIVEIGGGRRADRPRLELFQHGLGPLDGPGTQGGHRDCVSRDRQCPHQAGRSIQR